MKNKKFSEKIPMIILMILTSFIQSGCDKDLNDRHVIDVEFNFRENDGGWEPFFTGYNVGWEEKMELESDYRTLPEPLDSEDYGHFISAFNHSDDVKMLYRKQIKDLKPNMSYLVEYTIRFATDVPSGCIGIGGSPGEAVKVIASASQIKPEAIVRDDYYMLNIQYLSDDPGEWYQNAIYGDIANSRNCEEGFRYEIKEVSSGQHPDTVIADKNGRVWLMFGTRSGFEGRTDLFYTYFRAVLRR
jgi:hypothetical protein